MHRPVALVARRGTLYGPRPAAHEWRSGRVCTEAPSRPPPSSGKCSARLHGPAGCGGLPAAALREGRPPPRAAAKRSAATSQRGWRVGVPLPCTAVSGLPPLDAAGWPAPVGGRSRSPAAGGGVWGKPVKPSDGREGYKAANRAAAAAGAAAWCGEGGGALLGQTETGHLSSCTSGGFGGRGGCGFESTTHPMAAIPVCDAFTRLVKQRGSKDICSGGASIHHAAPRRRAALRACASLWGLLGWHSQAECLANAADFLL